MQKLSYIIIVFIFSSTLFSQTSPHGDGLKIDCNVCHTTEGWGLKNSKFDHGSTDFELVGQHKSVGCISCHTDLHFSETKTTCESCHTDIHENSVGFDCERCHTPASWVVSNIEDIHRMSRFPLFGMHKVADCNECHESNTNRNFKPLGATCYECHLKDYQATTTPNHVASNYSTDCEECHNLNSPTWQGAGIIHTFFPLIGGHSISNCFECHSTATFTGLTQECSSCHTDDYNGTTNPSHTSLGFSTTCDECHTIQGWQPATFDHDSKFFPIYSGEHNGEWNKCSDCHTNSNNYGDFSCLNCHEHNQTDMNKEHSGINGYSYESNACFACHPTGSEEGSFSHTQTFPLTGAHSNSTCSDCHTTSYSNTSSECVTCHKTNYDNAQNPNHQTLVLSQQCELCHTATNWNPSVFNHTTTGFELLGSHATVNCADCHESNVANAVQDCFACHENDYNSAPNHLVQNYPKECETCHKPTTWIENTFDHNKTNFPLTGAHINSDCSSCHASGYTNISTECSSCHQSDYNETVNPSHQTLGLSTDCVACHTTNYGWAPAKFPDHNNYFELLGAHATIANNCVDCHNSNYTNTSSTCFSCHETNYKNTTNPSHPAAQFPTICEECHSVNAWTPATFDHDSKFFPIYSGEHKGEWNQCSDCHTTANNYSAFSCLNCHEHNQTDMNSEHNGVSGYAYQSSSCYSCHPTGKEGGDDDNIREFKIRMVH